MEKDTSTLLSHVESGKVTYEQLKAYMPPAATSTWKPIAHYVLIDALRDKLTSRGYTIDREEFAVSKNGAKLFGVMDLDSELVPGVKKSVGFRHANDKSMALEVVAGGRHRRRRSGRRARRSRVRRVQLRPVEVLDDPSRRHGGERCSRGQRWRRRSRDRRPKRVHRGS